MTRPQPLDRRQFASDNYSGICPAAWESLAAANVGHAPAYGDDAWTERAADLLRELFETDCEVFFVFNGTAANSLSISAMCQSYHSVLCHELAHVETDECGGPEFFSNGTKVLLVSGEGGKLEPEAIEALATRRTDIHFPKPRVLSMTQSTEMGTVYTLDELAALAETARRLKLHVHLDGARFANAVASLGCSPREIVSAAGVDALCFGGTKNGMPVGDCVLFFNRVLAEEFAYRCKQAGQLASKMRFLAAPWVGMLESGAWLENARQANAMAARLGERLAAIDGVRLLAPVQANAVFVQFPAATAAALQAKGWRFYTFIGAGGSRLMTTWDTTESDVHALVGDVEKAMAPSR